MKELSKYICRCCGQEHDDWPALGFSSPTHYNDLTEEERSSMGELSSDFCEIRYPDETSRFIRCTITLKVNDHCEGLQYGIWVSLSEKSFQDYSDNYDNDNYEAKYFGWFSNELPSYVNTTGIPTTVFTRHGNQRPEVVPYQDFHHPLVADFYNGISKAEAERRIIEILDIYAKAKT
jgi:hypothetical protein